MAVRRSFKSDESFLEKLAIGAIGTRQVFDDLEKHNHKPIELERGSMTYKIWKEIKIKRIRVPDLLCLNCGVRVESRAKTKLEISMSHSLSDPKRGWDYGLRDDDYVGLVVCARSGDRPIDWIASNLVQYVSAADMRKAFSQDEVVGIDAKGVSEGFEARLEWPASVASADGQISAITGQKFQYRRASDNRTITLRTQKKGKKLTALVKVGDTIALHQVIAAVVPVTSNFKCLGGMSENSYLNQLKSTSQSQKYAAAKALGYVGSNASLGSLLDKTRDMDEHIYVRLEAAAAHERLGGDEGIKFLTDCLNDEYFENRLETVIVLGELESDISSKLLIEVLNDKKQHQEIRAGAAWVLGMSGDVAAMDAIVGSFLAVEEPIRIEAARALAKLATQYRSDVMGRFATQQDQVRPGIAWAIGESVDLELDEIQSLMSDDNARRWVTYILGSKDPEAYRDMIEPLAAEDPEVYFAVTTLWQILNSWVYGLKDYG